MTAFIDSTYLFKGGHPASRGTPTPHPNRPGRHSTHRVSARRGTQIVSCARNIHLHGARNSCSAATVVAPSTDPGLRIAWSPSMCSDLPHMVCENATGAARAPLCLATPGQQLLSIAIQNALCEKGRRRAGRTDLCPHHTADRVRGELAVGVQAAAAQHTACHVNWCARHHRLYQGKGIYESGLSVAAKKTKQRSALRGESALRCNPPISRGMIGRRGNGMIGCTASKQTCTGIPPPSIVILPGSLYCNVLEYSKWSG